MCPWLVREHRFDGAYLAGQLSFSRHLQATTTGRLILLREDDWEWGRRAWSDSWGKAETIGGKSGDMVWGQQPPSSLIIVYSYSNPYSLVWDTNSSIFGAKLHNITAYDHTLIIMIHRSCGIHPLLKYPPFQVAQCWSGDIFRLLVDTQRPGRGNRIATINVCIILS